FFQQNTQSLGNVNVKVAVLSTGIDYNHEDLVGQVAVNDDEITEGIDWRIVDVTQVELIDYPDGEGRLAGGLDYCDVIKDGEPHFVTVEINSCVGIGG
ncbi:MAG: hypothetical protein AAFX94_03085, partial [Myxococcota bacterium]